VASESQVMRNALEHARVREVLALMERYGLAPQNLIEVGGEDFLSPRRREVARRVDNCWALMARLGVRYTDFDTDIPTSGPRADFPSRRRRGERVVLQPIENAGDLALVGAG
jgi:hypothetical protein